MGMFKEKLKIMSSLLPPPSLKINVLGTNNKRDMMIMCARKKLF